MFAVSLWDDTLKRGILARDKMGKKPLYYFVRDGVLYFASEIKALLQVPSFERKINFEALHHYLSFKHVPCPLSIFQGISMLPPAHTLVFHDRGRFEMKRYWRLNFSSPLEDAEPDEERIVDELIEKLRRAVERRLMGDVPVGFFLSGGIDSGLTTALAAEISSTRIKTFTLVYPESGSTAGKDMDRRFARQVSQMYGTDHSEELVKFSSLPEELPRILSHFDEPFAGVVSTYYLSKLISKHIKVALAGDAADELFGSYLSHRLAFPIFDYVRSRENGDLSYQRLLPFEGRPGFLESVAEKEDWKWRYRLLVVRRRRKAAPILPRRGCNYGALQHLGPYERLFFGSERSRSA